MDNTTIVRLVHATTTFERLADGLILDVRRTMGVPAEADADVEAEFDALRNKLDGHFPEFCELFADLLIQRVGRERLDETLSAVNTEQAQRYLRVAERIEQDLERNLERLGHKLTIAARKLMANGKPSARESEVQS